MSAVYEVYESVFGQGFLLLTDGQVHLLTLPGVAADRFWQEVEERLGLRRAEVALAADRAAALEVEEYLDGRRRAFSFALNPPGTAFQQAVWRCLQEIHYGTTASYGEIARRAGRPGAARAVGAACGANPIALAIPCHRVVGAGGALTGFGGGLALKERLLRLEQGA